MLSNVVGTETGINSAVNDERNDQTPFLNENEDNEEKPYFLNKTMHLVVNSNSQCNTQTNEENHEENFVENENYRNLIEQFNTASIIINDDTSCDTAYNPTQNTNLYNDQNDYNEEQVVVYDEQCENENNNVDEEYLKPKLPTEHQCSNKSNEKRKKKILHRRTNDNGDFDNYENVHCENKSKQLCINENLKYTINSYKQNETFSESKEKEECNVQQLLQVIPQISTLDLDLQTMYLIDGITINRLLDEVEKIWNEVPKPIQKKVCGIVTNYNMMYSIYNNESLQVMNSLFKEYLVHIMRRLWKSVGFNWKNFYHQWSNNFVDIYDSWE